MRRSLSRQELDDGSDPSDAFLQTEDDLEDLLRPALRREDDALGMRPGYEPGNLILGTIFSGIPFAAYYLAKNAQAWRTRPGPGAIWTLGLIGLLAVVAFHIFVPEWPRSTKRLVMTGTALAFVILMGRSQKRAFSIALSHGIPSTPLLPKGLMVLLGSMSLHIVAGVLLVGAARQLDIPTPGLRERTETVSKPRQDPRVPQSDHTPGGSK